MKLDPNETVEVKRGLLLAALEYIGNLGTGSIPFGKVAELVAPLQVAAKAPPVDVRRGLDDGGDGS